MPEPQTLFNYIMRTIACEKDLAGKNVLITAGATQEKIDPVRFITNHSTGKMGRAIAENCMLRGAHVTLVNASVSVAPPMFVDVVNVTSAADMADVVKSRAAEQDIIIMTAAVADFCPSHPADEKIKKNDSSYESVIELERTEDILSYLGAHKAKGQLICGFSMETQNMLENSKAKLAKKNADMIVANNLKVAGAGLEQIPMWSHSSRLTTAQSLKSWTRAALQQGLWTGCCRCRITTPCSPQLAAPRSHRGRDLQRSAHSKAPPRAGRCRATARKAQAYR